MTQPLLSADAELIALLTRYDYRAMPPGIAARVAALRQMIDRQNQACGTASIGPRNQAASEGSSAKAS